MLERSGPALEQALDGLRTFTETGDEITGTVRLSVPELAMEQVLNAVVPRYLAAYPKVSLELQVEGRNVDIVKEGYDGGVRMENIPKDMVRVRLSERMRFVVVGAPAYLARHGEPQKPEDLLQHRCLGMRMEPSGEPYRWDLERERSWRIPVMPMLLTNDRRARVTLAEAGTGLAYVPEPDVTSQLEQGTLRIVLEEYAAWVPGFFLYFPSRKQASPAFRAFIDMVRAR